MIVGNNQYLTEHDVRLWLRDNAPDLNYLLDDFEFTSEEITAAMTACQDYWNETPPYLTTSDYTRTPYRFHLLQGTCANLLFMAAHRFRRNSLNYAAGGLTVQDQEKSGVYDEAAGRMWDQFKAWVAQNKLAINISNGWGYA